jgi:hypothetical protein
MTTPGSKHIKWVAASFVCVALCLVIAGFHRYRAARLLVVPLPAINPPAPQPTPSPNRPPPSGPTTVAQVEVGNRLLPIESGAPEPLFYQPVTLTLSSGPQPVIVQPVTFKTGVALTRSSPVRFERPAVVPAETERSLGQILIDDTHGGTAEPVNLEMPLGK